MTRTAAAYRDLCARGRLCQNSLVTDGDPRIEVLALLKRHGDEPTSFQMLEPGHSYWIEPDACIAYADVGSAWVTVGEPVCASEAIPDVVRRFRAAAAEQRREVRWFHVGEAFARLGGVASTHIGEQPVWDPQAWEATLKSARSLREQLRRARAKGVTTRVVTGAEMQHTESRVRIECEALIKRWLAGRRMDEMRFMVLLEPFAFAEERRYVVAEEDGTVIGFAAAVPIYRRKGWFLEDLLRDPIAPNGTAELLVDAMMRVFAAEGSSYATLGLAPLAGDVGPVLSFTRDATAQLYNFAGIRAFKEKLRPASWEPVFVAYDRGELGVLAMHDVLKAFAPGGLMRFGLNSLLHQRTLATALLAIGLVPWTAALALAPTIDWFPSREIQLAWVVFDVFLIGLLGALVRRWRTGVAELVSVLTTMDAILTLGQVLFWNIWTARDPIAWSLVVVGCVGPLLASVFFWRARRLALRSTLPVRPTAQR
jgi:phosphatidylglycerol lysyltransferase